MSADQAWDTAAAERAQLSADIGELRQALGDYRLRVADLERQLARCRGHARIVEGREDTLRDTVRRMDEEIRNGNVALGALCVEVTLAGMPELIDKALSRVRSTKPC